MTKKEKEIIKWCINELMENGREGTGDFTGAVGKLCRLVGWKYTVYETLQKKGIESATIFEIMKRR